MSENVASSGTYVNKIYFACCVESVQVGIKETLRETTAEKKSCQSLWRLANHVYSSIRIV